jgi:hypothetical protein
MKSRTPPWSTRTRRSRTARCPAVRRLLPLSRTPAEVWDLAPASVVAGAQLEASMPIYGGAVPCRRGADRAAALSWTTPASSSPSRPPPSTTTSLATTTDPQDSCSCLADPQSSLFHAAAWLTAATAAGRRCAARRPFLRTNSGAP